MGKNLLTAFLNLLKVKYTNVYVQKYFNEHPYKDSLYGISSMLTHYGINNKGIRIRDTTKTEAYPTTPFIAHVGKKFVIVCDVSTTVVKCIWNNEKTPLDPDYFVKEWDGIALIAQPDELSIEPNYPENRKKEFVSILMKFLLYSLVALFFIFLYWKHTIYSDVGINSLLLLNITGIYVSSLLLLKQNKGYSRFADRLCTMLKQGDCNNILETEASRILGLLSWSEIGLGYFVSNVLLILLKPGWCDYLLLLNICALPYTIWSVWYQKFKLGQWCLLCLLIQGLLWIHFIAGLIWGYVRFVNIEFMTLAIVGGLFTFCILIIHSLSDLSQQASMAESLSLKINTMKVKEEVFVALLKQQTHYSVSKEDSSVIFGNPEAKIRITIFSNPHCTPCRKMHKRIHTLLRARNDICVQYIFSSFSESLDISNKFLCAVYLNNSIDDTQYIYDEWFTNTQSTNQELFEKYMLNLEEMNVLNEFVRHNEWKKKTGLHETPTVLINGYKLPAFYHIEDIEFLTKIKI